MSAPSSGVVMQMMTAAWTAQTIATVARLGVADLVQKHGALTARELVETHRVGAKADLLERALRACASAGIFTESPDGRFGATPLSEVLTVDARGSVRRFVELIDSSCLRVLRNCRGRLPAGGRVVCIDKVLPPMGDTSAGGAKLLDMLMMVSLPGKERTEAEWRALYDTAGLVVTSITVVNPRSGESLIEGVAA